MGQSPIMFMCNEQNEQNISSLFMMSNWHVMALLWHGYLSWACEFDTSPTDGRRRFGPPKTIFPGSQPFMDPSKVTTGTKSGRRACRKGTAFESGKGCDREELKKHLLDRRK